MQNEQLVDDFFLSRLYIMQQAEHIFHYRENATTYIGKVGAMGGKK